MSTYVIDLPTEAEEHIVKKAAAKHMTVEEYIVALTSGSLVGEKRRRNSKKSVKPVAGEAIEPVVPGSLTAAEILQYWERNGAFLDMTELPDSPELARQIREQSWNRTEN